MKKEQHREEWVKITFFYHHEIKKEKGYERGYSAVGFYTIPNWLAFIIRKMCKSGSFYEK